MKARFQIFDCMADSVVVASADGRIVFANREVETLFGYDPAEIVGELVEVLIPASQSEAHVALRQAYMKSPEMRPMGRDIRPLGRHKDGSLIEIDIMINPLVDGDEVQIVAVIREVTELRQRERKLEELSELKDRFLGIAAHDLRNPLAAISGMAKMMLSHPLCESDRRLFLERIDSVSTYMLTLVNDLLEVSRIESDFLPYEPRSVRLAQFVDDLISIHSHHALAKGVVLRSEIAKICSATVNIDPDRLSQVLNNLVSNAIKFSHHGDEVFVRAATDGDSDLLIAISDQGIGIPADAQPTIFEAFQRARAPTAGEKSTGLGLWIVKKIVDAIGGSVELESELGQGSTFSLRIPTVFS